MRWLKILFRLNMSVQLQAIINIASHVCILMWSIRGDVFITYNRLTSYIDCYTINLCHMNSSRRCCLNHPDSFCYICGAYTIEKNRKSITDFVKQSYKTYFGIKLGDQAKSWAPHKVCKQCVESLRQWTTGKRRSLNFGVPMVWREQRNHHDDCYFCLVNVKGYNRHKKRIMEYPNLESARRPVQHSEDVPIPSFSSLRDLSDEEEETTNVDDASGSEYEASSSDSSRLFSQCELNDLVRDLNLSKEASELLASRLKEKNCLKSEVKITAYRSREEKFLQYFTQEDALVYCNNVIGLLHHLGLPEYHSEDWRLFIDSSTRSLKCVLLHNGNRYSSIPLAHSRILKEAYENIKMILQKISYHEHSWSICVDLKMVNFLLGQQSGFTKYPCFFLGNHRAGNYEELVKTCSLTTRILDAI
jgi:hypothetical protein